METFFPLCEPPTYSWNAGGRKFGAPRAGGERKHAGCDLFAPRGTPVVAIGGGTVRECGREFYRGTSSVAIHHDSGKWARYCEVIWTKERAELAGVTLVTLKVGQRVSAGQLIGHVGRMFSDSMLHFELYDGTAVGRLTNRSAPPFQRRSDLLDPSPLLTRLSGAYAVVG